MRYDLAIVARKINMYGHFYRNKKQVAIFLFNPIPKMVRYCLRRDRVAIRTLNFSPSIFGRSCFDDSQKNLASPDSGAALG